MKKITKILTTVLMILLFSSVTPTLYAGNTIDVNVATERELQAYLKGVGKKKAQAIVANRKKFGKFKTPRDLIRVKGFSERLFEKNKHLIKTSTE